MDETQAGVINRHSKKKKAVVCFFLVLALFIPTARAEDDLDTGVVFDLLKRTVDKALGLLNNETLDKDVRLEKLIKTIDPLFDFPVIAKLTLGKKYWPWLTKEQKTEFTDLFIQQLQQTYYDKFEVFFAQGYEIEKPKRVKSKIHVPLTIITKDKPITMLYKFYKKRGSWKIYDIEIQDISIVKSFYSQYSNILEKEGAAGLLNKMKTKALNTEQDKDLKQEQ